jgi:hypothetical protein
VGCLLVVVAIVLALEIKSLLIGEAASPELKEEIEAIVNEECSVPVNRRQFS